MLKLGETWCQSERSDVLKLVLICRSAAVEAAVGNECIRDDSLISVCSAQSLSGHVLVDHDADDGEKHDGSNDGCHDSAKILLIVLILMAASTTRALQLNGGCLGLSDILCDLRGFNGAEDVGVGRGDLGDAGDDVGFDDFEVDGFLCPLGNSLICTKNSLVCVIDSLLAMLDDILSRDVCNRIVDDD